MCGILAVIGKEIDEKKAFEASKLLSHRGPDEADMVKTEHAVLCHQRLSINDLKTGKQPIQGTRDTWVIHNGEIYNHKALHQELFSDVTFRTHSDSEIIVHLYEKKGYEFLNDLDGVFSFIVVDGDKVIAGRDPIGVKPLFYGYDSEERIWFASEYKALIEHCVKIDEFPPGHYFTLETGFVRYFQPAWYEGKKPTRGPEELKQALIKACKKRLMSDVPVGVLLSGGLDSSLVASIVSREMKKQGKVLKSFSVGISADSSDLSKARAVAEMIGTEHHEVVYTPEEGIALLEEMIHKLESYDVTTIRASTPMYIMSKYIRQQGVKVVLSGEGADEIFGGYLYFKNAPTAQDFHEECVRRVKLLNTADCLRADRSTMGTGVEARVPFLDKEFLEVAMELDPKYKVTPKGGMEKMVLRKAFDDLFDPYLPGEVLWRQKEQFSDGVGYSWVDSLKALAEKVVTDEEFATASMRFPYNTPDTKEAFMYRAMYDKLFPHESAALMIRKWVPKWQADTDPSGRASTHHVATLYEEEEEKPKTQPTLSA
ncbi:MAG: asparagine synthase B [Deltaproteobacteria bacterium]|nr:MAG: asparagine synthase B [Deltaproteobacteria bacterium]TNF30491.1 MAG: asparagine synthase B [Deltaproteobacteria bacterium]